MYNMGLQNLSHSFSLSIKHESLPEEVRINIEVVCNASFTSSPNFKIKASLDKYKVETGCLAYLDNRRNIDYSVRDEIIRACIEVMSHYLQERFYNPPKTLEEAEKLKEDKEYNEKIAKVREIMKIVRDKVVNSDDVRNLCPTLYSEKA